MRGLRYVVNAFATLRGRSVAVAISVHDKPAQTISLKEFAFLILNRTRVFVVGNVDLRRESLIFCHPEPKFGKDSG